jgi:hypothetical protein
VPPLRHFLNHIEGSRCGAKLERDSFKPLLYARLIPGRRLPNAASLRRSRVEHMNPGDCLPGVEDWTQSAAGARPPEGTSLAFKLPRTQSTFSLGTPFTDLGLTPTKTGGHFELTLPNPGTLARFFVLTLGL